MKINLPLETWVDIFGFLPRLQLGQLVTSHKRRRHRGKKCRPTIGDRQFVSFVQFYLHKCGEITLGKLDIRAIAQKGQPFPDVQMPNNIKSFKEIKIKCEFGHPFALRFLQKFQQNSLFTNVNLIFARIDVNTLSELLANILPLIDSIHSITFRDYYSYILRDIQEQHRSHEQVKMMSASVIILHFNWYDFKDDWFWQWLYTPRQDGKPRVLVLQAKQMDRHQLLIRFVKRAKKDFMNSNRAISFCIHIFQPMAEVQSISLDNCQTREKMMVNGDADSVTISRYPVAATVKWIKEMGNYLDLESRRIVINI